MSRTYGHNLKCPVDHEPKWWRKLMKHCKRRNELKKALQSKDWDNQVFPLDKKPWIYYW